MRGISIIVSSCVAGLLLLTTALSQTPETSAKRADPPKQINGGVLNGKATYLPKPNYPEAAKAAGASGAVTVQVLIDEQGYVATANAVSGHPLLRDAAVDAASSARFTPTTLNGIPVKISGVITYNFVADLSPVGLGYELAFAERTGTFGPNVFPESLAFQLPADWTAVRTALNSIAKAPAPPADDSNAKVKGGASSAVYVPRKLSADDTIAIRRVQEDIEARLRGNSNRQWAFRLGQALAKLVAEADEDYKFRTNIAELETIAAAAPPTIPAVEVKRLKNFIDKCKAAGASPDERKAVASDALLLRTMRV